MLQSVEKNISLLNVRQTPRYIANAGIKNARIENIREAIPWDYVLVAPLVRGENGGLNV